MSSTLFWEPVHRNKKELPDVLKYVLQKKVGGTVDIVMDTGDLSYLSALNDVGIEGSVDLINAIEQYKEVAVQEEF